MMSSTCLMVRASLMEMLQIWLDMADVDEADDELLIAIPDRQAKADLQECH